MMLRLFHSFCHLLKDLPFLQEVSYSISERFVKDFVTAAEYIDWFVDIWLFTVFAWLLALFRMYTWHS